MSTLFADTLVVVRGGGDLASGAVYRLHRAGFPVVVTELERPLVVRRTVAFAEAVFEGRVAVDGVEARRVRDAGEARVAIEAGEVPVAVDPAGDLVREMGATVAIDARIAKINLGMRLDDAPLVIGLGPGFTAGEDCHAVIETMRGHTLGRVIWKGQALPNTGVPESFAGRSSSRVLRAPEAGCVYALKQIGDEVAEGELIAEVRPSRGVTATAIYAPFPGVLRGLIHPDVDVQAGTKIGDLDPRGRRDYCFTISDKALAIGGGVLEAVLTWLQRSANQ
jgi:xanthine dehydrogenase accessory factor